MPKEHLKYVKGLDPVADAFAGTKYTDIVSVKKHKTVEFLIYKGVGTTGTSTITVEACDDVSGTTTSALAFHYQAITSGDTAGAYTAATTAGFTTTAGSSQLYRIVVDASKLASSGYEFIRLKAVEVADDPVLGGIAIILRDQRYGQAVQATDLS